jgi:hypothetical protein
MKAATCTALAAGKTARSRLETGILGTEDSALGTTAGTSRLSATTKAPATRSNERLESSACRCRPTRVDPAKRRRRPSNSARGRTATCRGSSPTRRSGLSDPDRACRSSAPTPVHACLGARKEVVPLIGVNQMVTPDCGEARRWMPVRPSPFPAPDLKTPSPHRARRSAPRSRLRRVRHRNDACGESAPRLVAP